MTTQEIAERLVELCREGKYEQAQKELYSDDAASIEPAHSLGMQSVDGLDNILKKSEQFQGMIEEVHGGSVSDPVVAANHFAVSQVIDVTLKGMGRQLMEEIAVYEVKDGKILKEQFIY